MQSIVHVTLVVRDYDEAIAFFTNVLDFALLEDRPVPEQGKRWTTLKYDQHADRAAERRTTQEPLGSHNLKAELVPGRVAEAFQLSWRVC